jgi:transcriptional regulator
MYIPKIYRNNDIEDVRDFIHHNGFATLVNQTGGKLWATHIPLVLGKNNERKDVLHGHIAKANPQWREFMDGHEVLAIFQGPGAYISSSWYDHENVPTWNYIAVHVYGSIRLQNEDELLLSLTALTDKYEKESANPVSVHSMSAQVLRENLNGLVGFEILVTDIHPAKKLSQNRDDKNYGRIIEELNYKADPEAHKIAKEMLKNRTTQS